MKPCILLQSDYSLTWGAVAMLKGVIKQVDPELEIYDLCHEIRSFDPWAASLSLASCEPFWPKGTIIVSIVDPGVGTSRKASCALLRDGVIVISPDNGSLTHMKENPGIEEIREIDEKYRLHPEKSSGVFDGRDLFSHCAALLASGQITFAETGPAYPVESVVECEEFHMIPETGDHSARGFIMADLPHFGGIQTNITNDAWRKTGFQEGNLVHTVVFHSRIPVFEQDIPFVHSFGFVEKGKPLIYCGSSGFVSLDCNQASFMSRYGIRSGKDWLIEFGIANAGKNQ